MEIKVFLNRKADKPVFCRIVEYNDSIRVDFQKLIEVFKVLFGSECVVCFNVF